MTSLLSTPEFWQYLSIPVIAALIGWTTNWLAIKMTFYPLEFVGKPPLLGWQGIIPSKARKMAAISVDLLTQRLTLRVLVKEVGVPLAELANETISLADLRAGAPAVRAVQLSLATRAGRPAPPPAVVHLNLTYNLLATEDPHDDGCSYEPSNSSVCS